MKMLFNNSVGKIAKMANAVPVSFKLRVNGLAGGSAKKTNVIISGMTLNKGVRVSYFETLGNGVFMYPLGDRPGKMSIRGIGYGNCQSSDGAGLASIIDFYEDYKLSRSGPGSSGVKPIQVSTPSKSFTAFLEEMTLDLEASKELPLDLVRFSLTLSVAPQ